MGDLLQSLQEMPPSKPSISGLTAPLKAIQPLPTTHISTLLTAGPSIVGTKNCRPVWPMDEEMMATVCSLERDSATSQGLLAQAAVFTTLPDRDTNIMYQPATFITRAKNSQHGCLKRQGLTSLRAMRHRGVLLPNDSPMTDVNPLPYTAITRRMYNSPDISGSDRCVELEGALKGVMITASKQVLPRRRGIRSVR